MPVLPQSSPVIQMIRQATYFKRQMMLISRLALHVKPLPKLADLVPQLPVVVSLTGLDNIAQRTLVIDIEPQTCPSCESPVQVSRGVFKLPRILHAAGRLWFHCFCENSRGGLNHVLEEGRFDFILEGFSALAKAVSWVVHFSRCAFTRSGCAAGSRGFGLAR